MESILIYIGFACVTFLIICREVLKSKTAIEKHKAEYEKHKAYLRTDCKARLKKEKEKRAYLQEKAEREAIEGKEIDFMPIITALQKLNAVQKS